jgi:DNA-binding NarL/FixJ family response regulator
MVVDDAGVHAVGFLDLCVAGTDHWMSAGTSETEIALKEISSLDPEIVIVDLDMQDLPGVDVVGQLRESSAELRIVAIATANSDGFKEAILSAGANIYVPKSRLATELIPAMRQEISKLSGLNAA